jgi:uncharacterized membrane protein AbrB (regulator of aidB expression)
VKFRDAPAWSGLIAASAAGGILLRQLGVPGPSLIAPLVVAIVAAVTGLVAPHVPRPLFVAAQAVGVDPLTAYLATTPGDLDSVTVIALGSRANVPLVLAVQALRVFVVIAAGPSLAKRVARLA